MKSPEEIKAYAKQLHAEYLKLTNEAIAEYKAEPENSTVTRDFFVKKSSEYINKAEAIWKIIDFIGY